MGCRAGKPCCPQNGHNSAHNLVNPAGVWEKAPYTPSAGRGKGSSEGEAEGGEEERPDFGER